jgi:hypothetical protein
MKKFKAPNSVSLHSLQTAFAARLRAHNSLCRLTTFSITYDAERLVV